MHQLHSANALTAVAKRPDAAATPAILRTRAMLLLAIIAATPFLLTRIPPLTDVPGHIGQFSVQTAAAGDGLLRYFTFHWVMTLNLASDLLIELLQPMLGVVPAVWLLCAATPALTVIGIMAIARVTNRRGVYALPWALLFVFNLPFLWGFLNFALTQALALIAFAGWIALERRRRLRAVLFLVLTPLLIVGHGVAGAALIGMIVGHVTWESGLQRRSGWSSSAACEMIALWPLLLAAAVTLLLWKALGPSGGGVTQWIFFRKGGAIVHMLQDQDKVFDIASVASALIVWLLGWRWGARLSGGRAGAVIVVIALFVAAPSMLSGSEDIDLRLTPLIPMLAFAMQDWSRVEQRRRRAILFAGFALLAVRFGVTTVSFAHYGERYDRELAALNHVPQGARIINLVEMPCEPWRSARLEHLGNLATTFRGAWVNSHWSIEGLHLLKVRYRPSLRYYNDPSQMVVPQQCVRPRTKPYGPQHLRQTVVQAMQTLPLDKVDYVWIVGAHLPPAYREARLRRVWSDDISELYVVVGRSRGAAYPKR